MNEFFDRLAEMNSGKTIILYVHGSKDPRWRGTFECFTKTLKEQLPGKKISLAYMEFVRPALGDVIKEGYQKYERDFLLIPLFMAGGAHIAKDLPEQVAQAKAEFPDVKIQIKPPIGEHPKVFEVMREVISAYVNQNGA